MRSERLWVGDCAKTSVRVGFPPTVTIAIPDLTFAPAITHVTSLSIMAAVAPTTTGRSSQQIDIVRSDNLPEKGTERFSGDNDEVRFFQDGSKTGARVLGE